MNEKKDYKTGCLICGSPLVYSNKISASKCSICHKNFVTNAKCVNGHFVCDKCHSAGICAVLPTLLQENKEKDPGILFKEIVQNPMVHMHGPEHHSIIPCVLLTAFRNNGGKLNGDYLQAAIERGSQVPGGACGYFGACGAAVGAGIFASIALDSDPMNKEMWGIPQMLTSKCLAAISKVGGPRCCKRTAFLSIGVAVDFSKEVLGVTMPLEKIHCDYIAQNEDCLKLDCPFFKRV